MVSAAFLSEERPRRFQVVPMRSEADETMAPLTVRPLYERRTYLLLGGTNPFMRMYVMMLP